MKEIYLIRHSKPGKCNFIYKLFDLQKQNEKKVLTKEGTQIANKFFSNDIFKTIEKIYSSNYLRAYKTAKILSKNNNLKVIVDKKFGERKVGIESWDEYPKDFEIHQFEDRDFKLKNGESLNEVKERELESLNSILNNTKEKRIAIVFHSTAMMILLSEWCEVSYDSEYYFNGKKFFDGKWNYCETFKLTFDENNNLIDIKNIRI